MVSVNLASPMVLMYFSHTSSAALQVLTASRGSAVGVPAGGAGVDGVVVGPAPVELVPVVPEPVRPVEPVPVERLEKQLDFAPGKRLGVQNVLFERYVGKRRDGAGVLGHHLGVDADFKLRVRVEPEPQKVKKVVQVDLPVHLGVQGQRQVDAGEFAGDVFF